MFCTLSSYPHLWIELLTTFEFEKIKESFCQDFFCKIIEKFYVEISIYNIYEFYTAYPLLWTICYIEYSV